jgi:hypothetical protein
VSDHSTPSNALEAALTKHDKAVLSAITACGPDEWAKRDLGMAATIWQIAETLNTEDLPDLHRTLNGLIHLEYAHSCESRARQRCVYWRTRKGDKVLA